MIHNLASNDAVIQRNTNFKVSPRDFGALHLIRKNPDTNLWLWRGGISHLVYKSPGLLFIMHSGWKKVEWSRLIPTPTYLKSRVGMLNSIEPRNTEGPKWFKSKVCPLEVVTVICNRRGKKLPTARYGISHSKRHVLLTYNSLRLWTSSGLNTLKGEGEAATWGHTHQQPAPIGIQNWLHQYNFQPLIHI